MKQITVSMFIKMKEIYKCIIKRIVDEGNMQESDILFIQMYKHYFESLSTKELEQ